VQARLPLQRVPATTGAAASLNRGWSAKPKSTGFAGAMVRRLIEAWPGFNATSLLAVATAIVGSLVHANLILLAVTSPGTAPTALIPSRERVAGANTTR
jgi:hypothetical protein